MLKAHSIIALKSKMMRASNKLVLAYITAAGLIALGGCSKKDTIAEAVAPTTLSGLMAANISTDLQKDAGLSATKADKISAAAKKGAASHLGKFKARQKNLSHLGNKVAALDGVDAAEDPTVQGPAVIGAAIASLNDSELALTNEEKLSIVNVITSSVQDTVVEEKLDTEIAKSGQSAAFFSEMLSAAIAELDEAGIEPGDVGAFMSDMMASQMEYISNSDMVADADLAAMAGELATAAIGSLDEAGLDPAANPDEFALALSDTTSAISAGFEQWGVAPEDMASYMAEVSAGATAAFEFIEMDPSAYASFADDITSGCVAGLANIEGFSDSDYFQATLGMINESAMNSLEAYNLDPALLGDIAAAFNFGSVDGLSSDNFNFSGSQLEDAAKFAAAGVMSGADWASDLVDMSAFAADVNAGATEAFSASFDFSNEELQAMLEAASAGIKDGAGSYLDESQIAAMNADLAASMEANIDPAVWAEIQAAMAAAMAAYVPDDSYANQTADTSMPDMTPPNGKVRSSHRFR